MDKGRDHNWGDYYYQGKRPSGRKAWLLEVVHFINQSIPTFNEIFDEETFYVFAFLVVVFSILTAVFLSKVVNFVVKQLMPIKNHAHVHQTSIDISADFRHFNKVSQAC
ncbi:unnamed protein product [Cylicocyclus nassatus]|uniref:Uncharacterized protein n=1 Tax=Cylicocyclus nassatus TaxID=53992 RepID=A0AA36GUU4_CYLNA|nr:unnamed protein product [Cylicocyclus nassatus]